jgi:hypothetical protein
MIICQDKDVTEAECTQVNKHFTFRMISTTTYETSLIQSSCLSLSRYFLQKLYIKLNPAYPVHPQFLALQGSIKKNIYECEGEKDKNWLGSPEFHLLNCYYKNEEPNTLP